MAKKPAGQLHGKLGLIDSLTLTLETETTFAHDLRVLVFKPPAGEEDDFAARLYELWQAVPVTAGPCYLRLAEQGGAARLAREWEAVGPDEIDIAHHFKRWALPSPGGREQLDELAARILVEGLDFGRPLWEIHLVEQVQGGRFALFIKTHHALFDGPSGDAFVQSIFSADPAARNGPPPWKASLDAPPYELEPTEEAARTGVLAQAGKVFDIYKRIGKTALDLPKLYGSLTKSLLVSLDKHSELIGAYAAPVTVLNHRITGSRQLISQSMPLPRLERIAQAEDATLNDVLHAIAGGALRAYLGAIDELPDRPLVSLCAVALDQQPGKADGNPIAQINVSLATDVADPRERLQHVSHSATAAMKALNQVPAALRTAYGLLLRIPMLPDLMSKKSNIAGRHANLTLSNAAWSPVKVYVDGAVLERYAIAAPMVDGMSLSIAAITYAGNVELSIQTCPDVVPQGHTLADHFAKALDELEASVFPQERAGAKAAPSAKRKAAPVAPPLVAKEEATARKKDAPAKATPAKEQKPPPRRRKKAAAAAPRRSTTSARPRATTKA